MLRATVLGAAAVAVLAGCCPPFCVTKPCAPPSNPGADTTTPRFLATVDTSDRGRLDLMANRTVRLSRSHEEGYELQVAAEDEGGISGFEITGQKITYGPGGAVVSAETDYDHVVAYQRAKACGRERTTLPVKILDVNQAQLYSITAEDFSGNRATLEVQLGFDCPAGWSNCSGYCTSLRTDLYDCGACGKRCGQGQACVGGQCVAAPQTPCAAGGSGPIDGPLRVSAVSLEGPASIREGGLGTYHVCFTIAPPEGGAPATASVWLIDEDMADPNDRLSWAPVNLVAGQAVYRTDLTLICRGGEVYGTGGNPSEADGDSSSGESTAEIFAQVSGSSRTSARIDVTCR